MVQDIGIDKFVVMFFFCMFVYVGVFTHYEIPFQEWFNQMSNICQQKFQPFHLIKY
jgi:hypothetical protein